MASEPVNGEGIDGVREKQSIKVYTRKGKGQRKQIPLFAFDVNLEKPEEKLENNLVNPPETLAGESDVVKSSVEEAGNVENSENQPGNDSDKVIDKPLVEAVSEAEPLEDVSLVATDKNVVESLPGSFGEDDVNVIDGGEKSVDVPSESRKVQDEVNTVVVDENSIKEPTKAIAEEDVSPMVIDKNPIEVPSQTVSAEEDNNMVVVDKNPIDVSSEDDVHVVDADNLVKEAQPENLVEKDATDAQQPTEIPTDSAQNIDSTDTGIVPMEEDVDGRATCSPISLVLISILMIGTRIFITSSKLFPIRV